MPVHQPPTDGSTVLSSPQTPTGAPTPGARLGFEPPPVTVVIPTYNRVGYLRQSIESALAQDYPHCRVLVADDGSTDGTADLVRSFGARGVQLVSGPHAGGPTNRNRAIAQVATPFLIWLGDDDVFVPDLVQRRVAALARRPDADIVHGDTTVCDAALTPRQLLTGEDWSNRPEALVAALFQQNVIADGGALMRLAVFTRGGLYDPAYPKGHDYHMWSRLALRARFVYDAGGGMMWRWHGANMGLSGGPNPYADCHRRLTLEMWARYDRRLLFPDVPWETMTATDADAVAALLLAERLIREGAWAEAHQFSALAVSLGAGPQAEAMAALLAERAGATIGHANVATGSVAA
jgi:O-antigen biosynthesis protein